MNPFFRILQAPLKAPISGKVVMILLALFASTAATGLDEDRNQSIYIDSDSAERDDIKGTTIYSGNVVMKQGSMRIDAEKVVIFNVKNKVTKIVAIGTPVRYQQKPTKDEELVIAQADRLEYDIKDEELHLIDNAFLEQDGLSLSGTRIDYDVKKSVVKAGGKERVKVIIPAHALNQDEE